MSNSLKKAFQNKINSMSLFIFSLNKYLNLNTIVYFPVLLSGIVFLVGFLISKKIYPINPPENLVGAILIAVVLTASLSGVIQIVIEEVPGWPWPIRGKKAVVFGSLWIIVFWAIGIYYTWDYFLSN